MQECETALTSQNSTFLSFLYFCLLSRYHSDFKSGGHKCRYRTARAAKNIHGWIQRNTRNYFFVVIFVVQKHNQIHNTKPKPFGCKHIAMFSENTDTCLFAKWQFNIVASARFWSYFHNIRVQFCQFHPYMGRDSDGAVIYICIGGNIYVPDAAQDWKHTGLDVLQYNVFYCFVSVCCIVSYCITLYHIADSRQHIPLS